MNGYDFLRKHRFEAAFDTILDALLYDMQLGLFGGSEKSGQDMCKTWILPPDFTPTNKSVIVIDAGGTNFRSCLVTFNETGVPVISDFNKTRMPGIEREVSKREFFSQIADNIEYLKNKSDKIGFCFSYALDITKDGDGKPNAFSKEIKASEVLGCPLGKNLKEELENRGWNKINQIRLINDTVAALLAGAALRKMGTKYSSYVGFVLGTGMNAAYLQKESAGMESQIIVCESGKFDKFKLSDIDIALDKKTNIPGQYRLEKCCSGAYLGKVGYEILITAARERLFSNETCRRINALQEFSLAQMDSFLHAPFDPENPVVLACANNDDRTLVYTLLDEAVNRCALYASAVLCANVIQSGGGFDKLKPVCISCNGTTFHKTHKLRSRIEKYLDYQLTEKRSIYFEMVSAENDITIGTALAGVCL